MAQQQNISFFEQEISPFKQVAFVIGIAILLMLLSKVMPLSPAMQKSNAMPWVVSCAMLLFFAMGNSILAFAAKEPTKYWMYSIFSFALLLVILSLLAYGISGVNIDDAGTIRWIYVVFTFGYLVLLSIVNLIRFFVMLAHKSDEKKRINDELYDPKK